MNKKGLVILFTKPHRRIARVYIDSII